MIGGYKQVCGENGTQIQKVEGDCNFGISYSEARQIALDVYKSNFLELSQAAAEIAQLRIEKFTDNIIETLKNKEEKLLEKFVDPDIQYNLFSAQQSIARNNSQDLEKLLTEVIIERLDSENKLEQIILNEAINTIPKLTNIQIELLSVIFSIRYSKFQTNSILDFKEKLKKYYSHLSYPNTISSTTIQHLEFTGCGTKTLGSVDVFDLFKNEYIGMFIKGFSQNDFNSYFINESDRKKIISFLSPCLNNVKLLQFNCLAYNNLPLEKNLVDKIVDFQNKYSFSNQEIESFLINTSPKLNNFVKYLNLPQVRSLNLTSVGIMISICNLQTKFEDHYNKSIWISE